MTNEMTRKIGTLRYFNKTHGRKKILVNGLSKQTPAKKPTTEEIHDEDHVINIYSELFKLNHKYGQLLNTNQKIQPTDQSTNMTLKAK